MATKQIDPVPDNITGFWEPTPEEQEEIDEIVAELELEGFFE